MFKLTLVTPEKKIVTDQELEEITLPAFMGELNILPGHAPLMTTLEAGVLSYRLKGQPAHEIAISSGYCQVSGDSVSVLAEHAKEASEVDVRSDEEQIKRLQERVMIETLSDPELKKVEQDVHRLQAEIKLVQETRH